MNLLSSPHLLLLFSHPPPLILLLLLLLSLLCPTGVSFQLDGESSSCLVLGYSE